MREVTLSLYDRGGGDNLAIQPLLDAFEHKHRIHVNLQLYGWHESWAKQVETALYGHGPDISEVGSTGVLDFVRMNSVNSLSPSELNLIGSEKDFFPTNWRSGVVTGPSDDNPVAWAIPWTADLRLVFFRRELLEQAKVDPDAGFKDIETIDETIAKLSGVSELPLALTTLSTQVNLHNLASWLWDAGGDLMAPDGKSVAFDGEKALRGMHYFFRLGRYLPAELHKTNQDQTDQLFISGKAAAIFGGYWIGLHALSKPAPIADLGIAAMPGASFVGGTNLLIWKHAQEREGAILLLDFLVKHSAEHRLFPIFGLPAYIPAWEKVDFIRQPYSTILLDALQKGRTFPVGELWGLVEKRLVDAIPMVWEKVLASSENDVDKVLTDTIIPLAKRLNMSFL
jgi:multiple sugar transport system substrate-binding protein